jgi:SAM-dependent methyltransferase
MLLSLIEPDMGRLAAQTAAEGKAPARRSGWAFDALLPYLMRDWTDTEELAAAKTLIGIALQKIIPDPTAKSLVVAGCGAAGLIARLPPTFGKIMGFDLTLPILGAARHLLDGKPLDVPLPRAIHGNGRISLHPSEPPAEGIRPVIAAMDMFDTAFADGTVDCVITSFLLDLIPQPSRLAAEIHRILSDGGIWINYGPSGPLKALWRFDNAECAGFFATAGFTPIHADSHRTTYLDLSQDIPSWSSRSHICYLTAARKTARQQETARPSPPAEQAQFVKLIPRHNPSASLVRHQSLGTDRKLTMALRFERFPGKMERVGIGAQDFQILELVDGKRTVLDIADLLGQKPHNHATADIVSAFRQYFEQDLLLWA